MSPLNLEPRRAAMALVDLMPRIIALPTLPHTGEQVFERCVRLADAFRERGGLVVWVRPAWPGGVPSDGTEPAVTPADGDVVVVKNSWGAFPSSGIDAEHRTTLTLTGVRYDRIDDQGLHITVGGRARLLDVDTVVICAGQEPQRELAASLPGAHLIGGADVAAELDAKPAIDQATRLALTL